MILSIIIAQAIIVVIMMIIMIGYDVINNRDNYFSNIIGIVLMILK